MRLRSRVRLRVDGLLRFSGEAAGIEDPAPILFSKGRLFFLTILRDRVTDLSTVLCDFGLVISSVIDDLVCSYPPCLGKGSLFRKAGRF